LDYDRLTDEEIRKLRLRIARLVVVFVELLHLLIARNRDMLLDVIQERKNRGEHTTPGRSGGPGSNRSFGRAAASEKVRDPSPISHQHRRTLSRGGIETPLSEAGGRPPSVGSLPTFQHAMPSTFRPRSTSDATANSWIAGSHRRGRSTDEHSVLSGGGMRTDSAIAVQSELQRAFISFCKSLYPRIHGIMQDETPRWLKQCAQDNYFSLGTYRQTRIPIAEELCFNASDSLPIDPNYVGTGQRDEIESPSRGGSLAGGSSHSAISKGSDSRLSIPNLSQI
jgi:hypothetical protein